MTSSSRSGRSPARNSPRRARTPQVKAGQASARQPRRARFTPEVRRSQLLRVAARLLSERGIEGLQFKDLAAEAKVTRPVVYRYFPTRRALVSAVLDDFFAALRARFFDGAAASIPGSIAEVTRGFVDAVCTTIEEKGAFAWHLMADRVSDPEIARLANGLQEQLIAPWRPKIAELTGAKASEVTTLSRMIVAAGRAVLELWYAGSLSREEAARDAARGVSALIEAFTRHETPKLTRGRGKRR
jgi:AcrR family transcriptional regulator